MVRKVRCDRRMESATPSSGRGQEGDVGRLDRDVGSCADRDTEVGLDECWCIVDAVADHRDYTTVVLESANFTRLVRRQHLGEDAIDADLGGDRVGGPRIVTSDHRDLDAHAASVARSCCGRRL